MDPNPVLVDLDSIPPGVSFTECVTQEETGHCCIDLVGGLMLVICEDFDEFFYVKVEEIQSEVRDPVLECVTRHQVTCHTSHVTNYVPRTARVNRNSL